VCCIDKTFEKIYKIINKRCNKIDNERCAKEILAKAITRDRQGRLFFLRRGRRWGRIPGPGQDNSISSAECRFFWLADEVGRVAVRDHPAETSAATAGRAALTWKVQTRVSSRSAIRVMHREVHSTPPTRRAEFQSVSKRRFVSRLQSLPSRFYRTLYRTI